MCCDSNRSMKTRKTSKIILYLKNRHKIEVIVEGIHVKVHKHFHHKFPGVDGVIGDDICS